MLSKYLNFKNKKHLVLSIISILVGLLLIFNPGSIILTYLKVTGIYLVIVSLLLITDHLNNKKNEQHITK